MNCVETKHKYKAEMEEGVVARFYECQPKTKFATEEPHVESGEDEDMMYDASVFLVISIFIFNKYSVFICYRADCVQVNFGNI